MSAYCSTHHSLMEVGNSSNVLYTLTVLGALSESKRVLVIVSLGGGSPDSQDSLV